MLLKIAAPGDEEELLDLQNAALDHVLARWPEAPVPRVLGDRSSLASTVDAGGRRRWVRCFAWRPGIPWAEMRPHSLELLEELGATLGQIDRALSDFTHASQSRALKWDLARGLNVAEDLVEHVRDSERRRLAERLLRELSDRLTPVLPSLRRSVIHNDANDYNILVEFADGDSRISGLIDFGDLLESVTLAEPAIALAYALLDKPDPIPAAAALTRGYHQSFSLLEDEIEHLVDLMRLRLLVSVTNSAHQRVLEPENEYLTISEAPAWRLLHRLDAVDSAWVTAVLRDACGFEPVRRATAVREHLQAVGARAASIVGDDLPKASAVWLDLSIGSPDLALLEDDTDLEAWNELIARRCRESSARVAFGRYDEPRLAYTSEGFRSPGFERDEWRTVHLGIDVFVPDGTPVQAPLPGRVLSVQENTAPRDYGPTVILEHRTSEGEPFWTLYGHLARACLDELTVGRPVEAGERIATIGDQSVNGGWPPHLHFQVMTELFGRSGDFPGVGTASARTVWRSVCPDPASLLRVSAPEPEASADAAAIRAARRERLGPSLSLSYRRPLHIVKGRGATLFDVTGQPYLDTVNNVCHVGHCHPRVVRAGQRQMAVLNTNTRYLHETIVRYAERLTSKLPDPLAVCFFVCSGSEANELALRLAKAQTSGTEVVVFEGGYHGNTGRLVELSHYKYSRKGGQGAGVGVHALPMPDPYRGRLRGEDSGPGYADFAGELTRRLAKEGRSVAAFLGESILSCGGQIEPPDGTLAGVYDAIRSAGGVCIADEVQTGFGRVGSHFWAFERQGVVPDIVTLGKPIGNGHPLAAVVTTRAIAEAFANGMEYFNTYGGNPVSCAIGEAVLDVIEEERLQERAARVGNVLESGLRKLQSRFPLIGDVRGAGLFLGFELVRDPDTREPDARAAAYVANRFRDLGILASTDGPDDNVLKIKPPLVISESEANRYVETLERVMGETALTV